MILNIAKRSPLAECGLTYYNVRNDVEHCIRCLVSISEYKLGVERLKDRAGDFWVAAATTRINDRLGILSLLQDPFKELPQVCDWKLHSIVILNFLVDCLYASGNPVSRIYPNFFGLLEFDYSDYPVIYLHIVEPLLGDRLLCR